eukprot:203950-Chlamydomonas_euryale.AAC.4
MAGWMFGCLDVWKLGWSDRCMDGGALPLSGASLSAQQGVARTGLSTSHVAVVPIAASCKRGSHTTCRRRPSVYWISGLGFPGFQGLCLQGFRTRVCWVPR